MKTILLKFAGPLQSWGTDSHFGTRHTDFYPSKSGVIGLIAAGLGYGRNEDEKIQKLNDVNFAVRVDQQGFLMKDYHIARKEDVKNASVTNRYYLEDAVFVIAISHESDELMDKIEGGLRYPYYQPFMGRRSLPLCADFIIGTTSKGVVESLKDCPWQAATWYMRRHKKQNKVNLEVYADNDLIDGSRRSLRKDRMISFSQKERKYGFRYENMLNMEVINKLASDRTEHDVMANI